MKNLKGEIDHTAYAKRLKKKSAAELRGIIADCRNTMEINPENPGNGYYQDEIHYAAAELKRRS